VLFKAWLARYEAKMKSAAHKLITLLQSAKSAPGKPAAATPSKPDGSTAVATKR
jgi:hypothetical protein